MSDSGDGTSERSDTSSVVALIRDLLQLYSKRRQRLRHFQAELRRQAGEYAQRKLSERELLSDELLSITHNTDDEWFELRLIGRALMRSPSGARRRLLAALPLSVAEDVRRRMWEFSDLMRMSNVDIQRILRHASAGTIAAALADAPQELVELILRNLSGRARRIVQEEREYLGDPDEVVIKEAQRLIADIIGRLVEAEEISMPGG